MPSGTARLVAFLHPAIAVLSLVLLFHVASLGLRSRERRGAANRPLHRRRAPFALGAILVSAASGILSTWLWRPDLELGAGPHFWSGLGVAGLLVAGALLSRRVPENEAARRIHPMLGLTALLLGILQVFFGLQLLKF